MNLWSVQNCETWRKAPKAARAEFLEQMSDKQYSASATQDAWDWYIAGWVDALKQL